MLEALGVLILQGALTAISAALALLSLYLLALTALALTARPRAPRPGPAQRRFAILVPAHDEEPVIARLLRSLAHLDYPADRFDVCVVADNCTDSTADIARSFGAHVYERTSATERAKGFALRWLLEQLTNDQRTYDAFVVLDADTVVEPNFLRSMDARLESGSQAIQAYYTVLNARASAVAGLRYAALAALHYLRPLGRARLSLSCGLKGNGMCFAAPVLERFAWRWYTLAEDVEFHLALVREGIRVDFAWETAVQADMPVTLRQARSQNARWERGRMQLLRSDVPRLLLRGLQQRSLLRIDAALEQLIPPLSVPVFLGGACLVVGAVAGMMDVTALAGFAVAAQVTYLAMALVLVRAPLRAYLALSSAPLYIAWKVGLYGQSLVSARASAWIRTARVPQ